MAQTAATDAIGATAMTKAFWRILPLILRGEVSRNVTRSFPIAIRLLSVHRPYSLARGHFRRSDRNEISDIT